MSNLVDFIRKLDFIGYSVNLKVNTENRYKSFFGGSISLIVAILSSAMIFYLGLELFMKTEPFVTQSKQSVDQVGPYSMVKDIDILIGMEFQNFSYYLDDRIFTVTAEQMIINYINNDTSSVQNVTLVELEMVKCSEIYASNYFEDKEIPLDQFLCLNSSAVVEGFWGAVEYKSINFYVKKCVNSTTNNKCLPQDEINSYIQNGVFSLYSSEYIIDQNNYTTPLKKYLRDIYTYTSSDNGVSIMINYGQLTFSTDTGSMFQNFESIVQPSISDVINLYSFGENDTFAILTVQGYNFGDNYYRSYSKLQDLITRIGGLFNGLTLISTLLVHFYSKAYYIIDGLKEHHNIYSNINNNEDITVKKSKFKFDALSSINILRIDTSTPSKPKQETSSKYLTYKNQKSKVKFSSAGLFMAYWCKYKNKALKDILIEKEKYINKSISTETISKIYFDIEIMKRLFLNKKQYLKIDQIYFNFFDYQNKLLYSLRDDLINEQRSTLNEICQEGLRVEEKLNKLITN